MPLLELLEYGRLLGSDETPASLRAALAEGRLVRVRRGVYADAPQWARATPEERVIARTRAVQLTSASPIIVSHESAAALHGLPVLRPSASKVHTIASSGRPGSTAGVVRHRGVVEEGELVEIHGILCTDLARTTSDVARTADFERAVTIADGALRRESVRGPGDYDEEGALGFRRAVRAIAARSAHGRSRAGRVLAFAVGRAQLPGESVSRVRLASLGFRRMILQRPVPGPRGRPYFVDFSLEDARALGEFDGSIKYVDGRMLDDRTTAEVFDREKQREDWIRGVTHLPLVRWGWAHIASAEALGRRLASFGIRPSV